jgi:ribonuclease BN (tRNA processing enzyme)
MGYSRNITLPLTKRRNEDLPEFIILGSGTGIPSLRRGSPGQLIFSDDSIVLIDSGSGTLRRMLEVGISYQDVDLLLYTHTHPDHVADLIPILFASKYADSPRQKNLICTGGPGFRHYFDLLKKIYGSWIDAHSYDLTAEEVSEKPLLYRDLQISSKKMTHLSGSVAYRIDFKNDKSITVSGDTGYCKNIIELANKTDLLVLECSFPDEKEVEGHLTPSLAGRIALESRCKKLLLTHLYPICDQFDIQRECEQVYKGDIVIGEDLMRIEV